MTVDDGWTQALDSFEAGLRQHAATLAGIDPPGAGPWPPPSLPTGPIPVHLRDRAFGLLDESRVLGDAIAARLASLEPPRRSRRTPRSNSDHPRISLSL